MRSDWHRYNLKRRIACLPPLSAEIFTEKVLSSRETSNAAAAKASFETACQTCQKTYFSENAYRDHLSSRKHKIKVLAAANGKVKNSQPPQSPEKFSPHETSVKSAAVNSAAELSPEMRTVVSGLKATSLLNSDSQPQTQEVQRNMEDADLAGNLSLAAAGTQPQEIKNGSKSSPAQTEMPLSRCIFCNYNSPTSRLNVSHMSKIHGLFIPEQDYLVDQDGLLWYLQAKVHQNFECLLCHKLKGSADGVQMHMRDKSHCMIAFETEEEMVEIGQFYDFTSTYSDDEDKPSEDSDSEDVQTAEASGRGASGGVCLPASTAEEMNDDGWETDSSYSSRDSAELGCVPIDDRSHHYSRLPLHRHHSHPDPRPHRNVDGFHSHAHQTGINAVFHDEIELHLPSGRTAGHRDFRKYYRQNLHSHQTAAERSERSQRLLEQQGQHHDVTSAESSSQLQRAKGLQALAKRSEAGMLGASDAQKREVRNSETRAQRQAQRAEKQYQARLEKQGNSQKHYRVRRCVLSSYSHEGFDTDTDFFVPQDPLLQ